MSSRAAMLFAAHENVPAEPAKYVLNRDVCTIGRSIECDIVVEDKAISRLHAKIEFSGFRHVLSDAGSINGTFINGRPLSEPHVLQHNDVIGLSTPKPLLRFEDSDPTDQLPTSRLRYDPNIKKFFLNYHEIKLTRFESRLLFLLYQHAGELCTRERCAEAIWKTKYDPYITDENALNRIVSNTRSKLFEIDNKADVIETVRGRGYILHL